ncbi:MULTISPECIES: CD3073 family putative ECF transporter S component [unclassified Brenneria]|uniref:CD3073 family putative ECF transporter S component n=1 Tax=unclassified Brenneria TaxID=2634434 RepID=UPI0029C39B16|nr:MULTISPECIES: CD3073 family putative ECF transporter S component [unclassified Brenneria]MDX5627018.1 ECF transporter S component [Brenneria sp. L3-3Z]MDX5693632.1 ECF transporter S component [Brenneria sp. L4-2C]MEE3661728.1 CD3073 family putative ECF transporter S component [Brenneria sp. g21c3]
MNQKNLAITFGALAVAINVIAGSVVDHLKIPFLFLDTIGTMFIAALFGPLWGGLVGLLTNLVLGVTTSYTAIPFALVNILVGVVVGYSARKKGFQLSSALFSGILLGFLCPAVGTVIAIGLFGGLTGGLHDVAVLWLKQAGSSLFTAAFLPRLAENLVDKILSALLVYYVVKNLPPSLLRRPVSPVKDQPRATQ